MNSRYKPARIGVRVAVTVLLLSVPALCQDDHRVEPLFDFVPKTDPIEKLCTFRRLPTLQAIDIGQTAPRTRSFSIPSWLVPVCDRYPASTADSAGPQLQAPPTERVSLKAILRDFRYDQKQIWTFPVAASRGEHWKPILGFFAVTSALVLADPHDTAYSRRTQSFHGFNEGFSSTNTGLGEGLLPPVLYLAGMVNGELIL